MIYVRGSIHLNHHNTQYTLKAYTKAPVKPTLTGEQKHICGSHCQTQSYAEIKQLKLHESINKNLYICGSISLTVSGNPD